MPYLKHGEFEHGFGWIAEPEHFMQMSSTVLAVDGRAWLIDPLRAPGIEGEIERLGKPVGIIMTIGWHDRDVDWFAARYGIPVYAARHLRAMLPKTPVTRVQSVPETPFRFVNAGMTGIFSFWAEGAVWWPEQGVLVTGDSLGSASYFVRPGERLAVHPIMRLAIRHDLAAVQPRRVYCGHGVGVYENAPAAVTHALRTARSELLPAWKNIVKNGWSGARRASSSDAPSR